MSRKDEYLARAQAALALADQVGDPWSRDSLLQAAASWRQLADLEEQASKDGPTRWEVPPRALGWNP